ncbi:uncharacterized protein [Pempheris klunzingeri]|uniref:uncharacterized protein n=1 Tax=Pempheris klunzingeri TaxID=3127111 RepID=UPI00397F68F9
MLLLSMTVCCILFGSSAGVTLKDACYGRGLFLPHDYAPPIFNGQIYLTPNNQGSKRLLMDNGEVKDPRIIVSHGTIYFKDLTEQDEGMFSISFNEDRPHDIIKLKIMACVDRTFKTDYGAKYFFHAPDRTEFLEFTPSQSVDQPKVLWNRTDPQIHKESKGQMRGNVWEISSVTQADSGYYNFRDKDNALLFRIQFTVTVNQKRYVAKVNEKLVIQNPWVVAPWTVTFLPEGETEGTTVMKDGKVVTEDDGMSGPKHFKGRIGVVHNGIAIDPVENTDFGSFEFRDPQGNLAQAVKVEVIREHLPTFVYVISIIIIVVAVVLCSCYVKKYCCKKSSSKKDQPAPQTAAASAVYYHDQNQPAGPTYSATPGPACSYQPMKPQVPPVAVSAEPETTSLEAPAGVIQRFSNCEVPPQGAWESCRGETGGRNTV